MCPIGKKMTRRCYTCDKKITIEEAKTLKQANGSTRIYCPECAQIIENQEKAARPRPPWRKPPGLADSGYRRGRMGSPRR